MMQILIGEKRHTIRFGNVPDPEVFASHVAKLAAGVKYGQAVPMTTVRWLAHLDDKQHKKLVRAGLAQPRNTVTATGIGAYFDGYTKSRTDLGASTLKNIRQTRKSIVDFFGEHKDMNSITRGEAGDWRRWALEKKAGPTVAMYVKKARQVYADAIDRKLVAENPFKAVKVGSMTNAERLVYVPAATVQQVIDDCPVEEWKLAFLLARFAGCRVPSETKALRWIDVLWDQGRMRVRSPKTKHHEGKEQRMVPIFPEIYPLLRKMFEDPARTGDTYVFTKLRGENLNTQASRIIENAGLVPWVKPWQNLRSSCETDLTMRFPLHVVCAWIGNTEVIARKHYLQVTEQHFQMATESAAESAAEVTGNDRKQESKGVEKRQNHPENPANSEKALPPVGAEHAALSLQQMQAAHVALQSALHNLNPGRTRRRMIHRLDMAVRRARVPLPASSGEVRDA